MQHESASAINTGFRDTYMRANMSDPRRFGEAVAAYGRLPYNVRACVGACCHRRGAPLHTFPSAVLLTRSCPGLPHRAADPRRCASAAEGHRAGAD